MRTQTIEQTIYSYSDLLLPENDWLKEIIIKKWQNENGMNIDYDWYECVYDDFKTEIAPKQGFKVDKIYFSGFSSQGDGAMFEGRVTDFSKFISDSRINKLINIGLISLEASFEHSGHYYHEKSYEINFDVYGTDYDKHTNIEEYFHNIIQDEIKEKYEDLCKNLYRNLEKEWNYLQSDDSILETIASIGYEFDEYGNIV